MPMPFIDTALVVLTLLAPALTAHDPRALPEHRRIRLEAELTAVDPPPSRTPRFDAGPDTLPGGDARWSNAFIPPGPVGPAGNASSSTLTAVAIGNRVLAAGDFAWMDGQAVEGAAMWDGDSWEPSPVRLPTVNSRFFCPDGSTLLSYQYVFNDGPASPLAWWNGSDWVDYPWERAERTLFEYFTPFATLGDTLFGIRTDLYPVEVDTTDPGTTWKLAAADRAVLWSGHGWEVADAGIMSGWPVALHAWEGRVFAGGNFLLNDDGSTQGLAWWNGRRWTAFEGGEVPGTIRAFATWRGDLVALGTFDRIGGVAASGAARWDGTAWHPLGEGLGTRGGADDIHAVTVVGDSLVVAGEFTLAGGLPADGLARWDGETWHPMISAVESQEGSAITALIVRDGELYSLARFESRVDGRGAPQLRRWNGGWWDWPGGSRIRPVDPVSALLVDGDDIVAGGRFVVPGSPTPVFAVARRHAGTWTLLGDPMDGTVLALARYGDDIVAGGWFTAVGSLSAGHLAAWDGAGWRNIGDADDGVIRLEPFAGRLVAGGEFKVIDGTDVNCVASWDGVAWEPLGLGMLAPGDAWVSDFAPFDGGLAACGRFEWAGSAAVSHIALWDGRTWSAIGTPRRSNTTLAWVNDIESVGGLLYFATPFLDELVDEGEGPWYGDLGVWDGRLRREVVSAPFYAVGRLGRFGPWLVAGGMRPDTGDGRISGQNSLLFFDGHAWWSPGHWSLWSGDEGSYVSPPVTALAASGRRLYAAGRFRYAGATPSFYVAAWDADALPAALPHLLLDAAPNPARTGTAVSWSLDDAGDLDLRVFDVGGRLVRTLESGPHAAGIGESAWDLRDARGLRVAAGVYFARATVAAGAAVLKLVVLP